MSMVTHAFKRQESRDKVPDFALGMLCSEGRSTTSNGILYRGKEPEKGKYLREARKKQNVSRYAIPEVRRLRERLDQRSAASKKLLYNCADGSFANKLYLNDIPKKTVHIVRFRKDARLRKYRPQKNGTASASTARPSP